MTITWMGSQNNKGIDSWSPMQFLPGWFPKDQTKQEKSGSQIGSTIGGLIGSIFGPIGNMAGSKGGGQIGKNLAGIFEGKDIWPILLDQFVTGPISGDASVQGLLMPMFNGIGGGQYSGGQKDVRKGGIGLLSSQMGFNL